MGSMGRWPKGPMGPGPTHGCSVFCIVPLSEFPETRAAKAMQKMTELITNLCSVPNQAAIDGLKDLINLDGIDTDQKVKLLVPIVENELFESSFKSKLVQYIIKHKDQVRSHYEMEIDTRTKS